MSLARRLLPRRRPPPLAVALLILTHCLTASGLARAAEPAAPPAPAVAVDACGMTSKQARDLAAWYAAVAGRRPSETFGELVQRSAAAQLDRPYLTLPYIDQPEGLTCDFSGFDCVTLVEESLALARCIWSTQANASCYAHELTQNRYRDGRIAGHASKMHYYEEWLQNNARRGQLQLLTAQLGGRAVPMAFNFMTRQPHLYPFLADPAELDAMRTVEAQLSRSSFTLLPRTAIPSVQMQLRTGDIIAVVGTLRGMLITHTGLVARDGDRPPHFLHASSKSKQVKLSDRDLASYVLERGDRRGIMVARPLPPTPSISVRSGAD